MKIHRFLPIGAQSLRIMNYVRYGDCCVHMFPFGCEAAIISRLSGLTRARRLLIVMKSFFKHSLFSAEKQL